MKKIIMIAVLLLTSIGVFGTAVETNAQTLKVQISRDRHQDRNRRNRDYRRDNRRNYPTRESYFTRIEFYRGDVYRATYSVRYDRYGRSIVRLVNRVRVR